MIKITNTTPHSQSDSIIIYDFICIHGEQQSETHTIGLPADIDPLPFLENKYDTSPEDYNIEQEVWANNNQDALHQQALNDESLNYLNDTDWYVTRKLETGVEIPQEIMAKRAQSRLNIQDVIYTDINANPKPI
jgi:acyl-CoA thioesterase